VIEVGALEPLLAGYLSRQWNADVTVTGLRRFHGGAARETYRFDAAASGRREALVLRRDPPSSLIETDRAPEFAALRQMHALGLPVPEPLYLETGDALGSPAFIMREVPGVHAAGLFTADPYGEHRAKVGRQLFETLGRIHAADTAPLETLLTKPAPNDAWRLRLSHWRRVITEDSIGPEPVAAAALRWLEANPPPPAERVAVVHGDYRSGNFLVDDAGDIRAIVDWEMVHLGDPLEDLAWVADPLWGHGEVDVPAATLLLAEAVAIWERASGLHCDPAALRWWRVFAQLTGLAIWISSTKEVAAGRNMDPVIAFSALYPYRFHSLTLARTLRELAG
jgi:aminoglycoside phosphotransferase (APT) family kinase protein